MQLLGDTVKAKHFKEIISRIPDEEEICAILPWRKVNFDYEPDDDYQLTDEAWSRIVNDFDLDPNLGWEIAEAISDAVSQEATPI